MMETFIVKPRTKEQLIALKAFLKLLNIDYQIESNYNETFVSKILQGREDIKNGKVIPINVKDLWV
jgi:adenylate kinase family enzyme